MVRETREFWVSDEPEEAVRKAKITLNKLGELQTVSPGVSIGGTVAFGMQQVDVRIQWRPEAVETKLYQAVGTASSSAPPVSPRPTLGTMLLVEARVEDRGNAKAATQSVLERFEDTYLHFDRPDYQPDRSGGLPLAILGITLAVGLLLFLLWNTPAVRRLLLPQQQPPSQTGSVPAPTLHDLHFATAAQDRTDQGGVLTGSG